MLKSEVLIPFIQELQLQEFSSYDLIHLLERYNRNVHGFLRALSGMKPKGGRKQVQDAVENLLRALVIKEALQYDSRRRKWIVTSGLLERHGVIHLPTFKYSSRLVLYPSTESTFERELKQYWQDHKCF
jgi:hypothetical protein